LEKTEHKSFQRVAKVHINFLLIFVFLVIISILLIWRYYDKSVSSTERLLKDEALKVALEVRDEFQKEFSVLETVNELWSPHMGVGVDTSESVSDLIGRYKIKQLGYITENNSFVDYTGVLYVADSTGKESYFGMTEEYLDAIRNGERKVFFVTEGEKVVGVVFATLRYKDHRNSELTVTMYDANVFGSAAFTVKNNVYQMVVSYSDGKYVDDGHRSALFSSTDWTQIIQKQDELYRGEKAEQSKELVRSTVNRVGLSNGKKFYFVTRAIDGFEDYYAVYVVNTSVFRQNLSITTTVVTILSVLLVSLLILTTLYMIRMYREKSRQLYEAAYVDTLTGLPSKTKHKLDAQSMINKKDKSYVYVVFDVDNFKYINEVFGYEFGNRLLINIANVLRRYTDEGEICSRVSGDNFAALFLFDGDNNRLEERLERIFANMAYYADEETGVVLDIVKFSCGVFPVETGMDINKVRANANLARVESKKKAFRGISFYNEELKTKNVADAELEYDAEEALKNGEFLVYFQPKYCVTKEEIVGAEALIRWKHSKRGLISPGAFIPLFETNGFIVDIDLFVLNKACELIAKWMKEGIEPITISVNLSRTHLYEQNLVAKLADTADRYKIPRKYIEFELTESAIYDDLGNLLGIMDGIKREGFKLSMDDFGSGYSSLNLLKKLPVDVLKLDKEFLTENGEMVSDGRDRRIVWHVISMAKDLNMEVLAEGVETKEQKDFLKEAQCDIIQGFYYSKPLPVEEFEQKFYAQMNQRTLS